MDVIVTRQVEAPVRAQEINNHFLDVGELLVACLESLNVDFVFGVPGGAVEPFYNAMARSERRDGLRVIAARNETGAAYMAQGYYQETGKLGVCVATTGPGATNLITGVASAFLDEVPMLVITGMNSHTTNGKAAFQDSTPGGVDTFALFNHCTRYNALVTQAEQFERELYTALQLAFGEQPGPVHLCLPVDILSATTRSEAPSYTLKPLSRHAHPTDMYAVDQLLSLLKKKPKIALVIGEYCHLSAQSLVSFAEHLSICFVTLPGAKGLVNPDHPLYRGVFGFAGHFSAREALTDPELDFVLVAGSALSEWDTAKWDKQAIFNSRLIHIDPVVHHLAYTPMARMHVRSDISFVFDYLRVNLKQTDIKVAYSTLALPFKPKSPGNDESTSDQEPIHPARLMTLLGQALPTEVRYFVDAGNSMSWCLHYLHTFKGLHVHNKHWFRISMRFAAMGWGIGNAVGAALGNRRAPVVCITGDGSLLMNGQEFTVALSEQLPVIFIVLNDSNLGMVRHGQRLAGAEPVSFQLPKVNFSEFARSLGGNGIRCETIQEIEDIDFDLLFQLEVPTLIDVGIDPDAEPPMHNQVKNPEGISYV